MMTTAMVDRRKAAEFDKRAAFLLAPTSRQECRRPFLPDMGRTNERVGPNHQARCR